LLIWIQAFAESRYIPDPDIERGILSKNPSSFGQNTSNISIDIPENDVEPKRSLKPYRELFKQEIFNLFLYLETNLTCLHPDFHIFWGAQMFSLMGWRLRKSFKHKEKKKKSNFFPNKLEFVYEFIQLLITKNLDPDLGSESRSENTKKLVSRRIHIQRIWMRMML
jgi:hypothetical protein